MTKTYLQLAREIATLQAAADRQLAAEKKEAVARLNEVIAKYDLSAADLRFPGAGAAAAKPITNTNKSKNAKPIPGSAAAGAKYTDGTGNTWGGRGPRPHWLREAIAAGKSLESFKVSAANGTAPMSDGPSSSATAKVVSGKAGFTVAPKYRHPGTGDTWSGRGSAPRWMKEALRKRGSKPEDFLIGAPAATASPTSVAKTSKAVASQRKVASSATSSPKPSAKVAPVKAPAAKKASAPKASPKRGPASKKSSVAITGAATGVKKAGAKKSTPMQMPAPAKPPMKKAVATRKSAPAAKPVAKKTATAVSKPAGKRVAAKKPSTPTAALAAGAGVPATTASGAASPASETSVTSPAV